MGFCEDKKKGIHKEKCFREERRLLRNLTKFFSKTCGFTPQDENEDP